MKRRYFKIGIVILFLVMLVRPKEVFQGASEGLVLWFQTVLPTLLPFIIVSNLLVFTNAITYISEVLGPLLRHIFGVSKNGSFAILTGFLCGYPMGAKVTSDLIHAKHISVIEGKYLLSFCNNTSPVFIMSYVVWQNLKREDLIIPSILILFLAPILCSFLFRFYYRKELCAAFSEKKENAIEENTRFGFEIVDKSIMNSFETIIKVGGYIILFSVILTLLKELPVHTPLWNLAVLPMIEITNGVPLICSVTSNFSYKFILSLTLTSFGGICSIAQTKCMIQNTGLSILPYIIEKLITALVTSFIAYLYIC